MSTAKSIICFFFEHNLPKPSLKRASKAADLIFMYMYYIYADEISIVSAHFGLPQYTASGPAGYSCLINRHKANKQCDHPFIFGFLLWKAIAGVSDQTAFCRYAVVRALYAVLSLLYAVVRVLYVVLSPLYTVRSPLYAVVRALYAVLSSLYGVLLT